MAKELKNVGFLITYCNVNTLTILHPLWCYCYLSFFQVLDQIDQLYKQDGELMHPLTSVQCNQNPDNGMFKSVHKSLPSQAKTNVPRTHEPEEQSPAYHNSWAHGTISPPSGDMKEAGVGAGSSESGESNSTSTEV